MTAEEAYKTARDSVHEEVMESIAKAAQAGRFETDVMRTRMYKALEDELAADGYDIERGDIVVKIKWSSPRPSGNLQKAGVIR